MDMKPPISRAKMILITKAAIKAIKVRKIFNLGILLIV
jgi:arginine/serine-rich splicing factor 15